MSLFDLSGHVTVVTGGNGGIGLGMAEGLAAAGAAVSVWGRDEAKNATAVEKLRSLGAAAEAVFCDVSSEESVVAAMAATLERFDKVDSCFANAGIGPVGTRFTDMTMEEWRRLLSVNLDGVFLTFREATRHMVERGEGGSLVVTSSLAGLFGFPRGEHYAASKAAVSSLARSIAVEHARHGIRANAILPGWVETALTEPMFFDERFAAAVMRRIPMRRWGTPADFAGIAVYLASDASSWHTADTIVIDGGYTAF